jgi:hypothetical protein
MTIRDITIALLQQLPESFLPEVSDFIDFVMHKHQNRIAEPQLAETIIFIQRKSWPNYQTTVAIIQ